MQHTHFVEFFDSMTMRNRTEMCRVLAMRLSEDLDMEDMATVEVETPIRKRLRLPITCLTCRFTGQRLPFPVEHVVVEEFEIDMASV